ncbi:ATP-binding protein [Pseudomonas sp. LS44]|uniref:ATP-binding protein n=1 Tax=Pseudomonas sp. LS44 TaxID=1357074 RepID=UPI00215B3A78|nr:ATP-binding protein [Pseudomonas sp. LS44]UVE17916.1 ATP-binding protein [Pseudomonas sp. LS44]
MKLPVKLPMKLRTRLFLSISALISVALLGLLLGLISVMQMARNQEQLIQYNFAIVDTSQQLREHLSDILINLIDSEPANKRLRLAQTQFREALATAISTNRDATTLPALRNIESLYEQLARQIDHGRPGTPSMHGNGEFAEAFTLLRQHIINVQKQAINSITDAEADSRERAKLIAGLLGLVGITVLLIGFITANSVARRFGAPIDMLARAAEDVSKGNYDVTLPISSVVEMSVLSRRFGQMTEALRQHQLSNVSQLMSSQHRLQAVLDSIDDGLVILDAEGRIEHANPVATHQLFWRGDPHGQRLGAVLAYPELEEAVQQVFSGTSLEQPHNDLQIDSLGEHRVLAWTLTPVQHGDNDKIGAVLVLRDVTEQRAFERVRNEFVLRASHELRTPVTGMHMAFSLLRERLHFPAESRETDLIQTVDEEMQRLVQLISDLLNFSRYQNGMQKVELAPNEPGELLEQARQRFTVAAGQRAIRLEVAFQGSLPRISIDRALIDRVLDNLLSNALRHSKDGDQVELQARRHGERVVISVQDQGEGIPFSQQARIFEPFVQVSPKKGGVGLGLALCKEVVQMHGGRINVYSRPGQGAQFYLTLPI